MISEMERNAISPDVTWCNINYSDGTAAKRAIKEKDFTAITRMWISYSVPFAIPESRVRPCTA